MVTLRANNPTLLTSAKFSYLSTNYLSGVTSLVLTNSDGFFPYTIGGTTSQFDITNPTGTTFRYTYDGTGTDPDIDGNIQVNSQVVISGTGFNAANNGTFTVTAVSDNYFEVTNASGVAENNVTIGAGSMTVGRNNYVLLGEFGNEQSEIVLVTALNKSTHTLTVGTTKFAHSQDTKVYALPYNQVKFYHTTTTTFSSGTPVTGYIDLQADSTYTIAQDFYYTTGYGWYVFYNSVTAKASSASNAIPYAGFTDDSVKNILDSFYSLLNEKEKKLISSTDALSYLNAGLNIAQNELNMINKDYFAAATDTVTTTSGTAEYDLETDFSYVISVYNETDEAIVDSIPLSEISFQNYYTSDTIRYYIRGKHIGFSPTPADTIVYTVRYAAKTTVVSSYYDSIDLPGNNHYILVDYMMFRACPKIGRGNGDNFKIAFDENIKRMKIGFHKTDGSLDSMEISDYANI